MIEITQIRNVLIVNLIWPFLFSSCEKGSSILTRVKSFICGGVNLLNWVSRLLSLPYAHVGQKKCNQVELLPRHRGLQLD